MVAIGALRCISERDMYTAESILLPLQELQLEHDRVAHPDILSFGLQKRLKHMVLHFFKYAGKIEEARGKGDEDVLRTTLLDTFIICMASANALNVSIGEHIPATSEAPDLKGLASALSKRLSGDDLFREATHHLLVLGGQMAKAVESIDHTEDGNFRRDLNRLVPMLAGYVIALLGQTCPSPEAALRLRFEKIESKSIFSRLSPSS